MSEAEFWACAADGTKPDRGIPEVPAEALPADIVFMLLSRVRLPESALVGMTKEEALARLQRYWITGS